jgi:sigma-B regulation protein RsbU (phosphoserine phosphatase)
MPQKGRENIMETRDERNPEKYDIKHLERQLHNLGRLVEINNIINSTLDMARLLSIIMENIKSIMAAEASTLLLYEEKTRDLVFKVALGEAGKDLEEKYRMKIGQGIAGWVAEHRTTVYINDVYSDARFDPNFDKKTGFTTKSLLCAPLLFKGKLLGVIQAINPTNRPGFDDEDVALFNAFASQCVLAVQNAIFFQNALEEERIRNEIAAAHAIQGSLLPEINKKHGRVTIAAKSMAAREVGGEFYDIFLFGDGSIGMALGDLHAKGIPGALYASITSGAVKALSGLAGANPSLLLKRIHEALDEKLHTGGHLSLFYGVVRGDENTLHFATTGVAYPILVRGCTARYLRFGGDFGEKAPRNVRVKLEGGDFFVIITDGMINCKNRRSQLLGLKRVMRRLEGDYESPDDVIRSLIDMMNDFSEGLERREDVSVLVFRYD